MPWGSSSLQPARASERQRQAVPKEPEPEVEQLIAPEPLAVRWELLWGTFPLGVFVWSFKWSEWSGYGDPKAFVGNMSSPFLFCLGFRMDAQLSHVLKARVDEG